MRKDLTDLTIVLDRSGSMASCRTDAEGGLNEFIRRQKELPGDCNFTLVQFDDVSEVLYRGVPLNSVSLSQVLQPRGNTALLDALGRAIVDTGERLKAMPEHERPGLVVFVVITDGQENASREFSKGRIRDMIGHQQSKYAWQFTFLGANQDAFTEAGTLGFNRNAIANYSGEKTSGSLRAASSNVARMRGLAAQGSVVDCAYTDEERKAMA